MSLLGSSRCRTYLQRCQLSITDPQPALDLFAVAAVKPKIFGTLTLTLLAFLLSGCSAGDVAIVSPHEDIAVEGDVAAGTSTRIGGNSAVVAQLDVSRSQVNITPDTRYTPAVNNGLGVEGDRIGDNIDAASHPRSRTLDANDCTVSDT